MAQFVKGFTTKVRRRKTIRLALIVEWGGMRNLMTTR